MAKHKTERIFTPEEFLGRVAVVLPDLVGPERFRLLTYARAWADVNYPERLPAELDNRLQELEGAWL